MKHTIFVFLIILSAVILMSCSSTEEDIAITNEATPTESKKLIPPATNTQTATLSPSKTPTPSQTPYPTATIPVEKLSAISTLDALVTQNPELGAYDHILQTCILEPYACLTNTLGLSPNGLWATFFSFKEAPGLIIVSIDGTKYWEINYSELTGIECPCGEAVVTIDHWSKDGKYLYLVPDMRGDGGYYYLWRNNDQLIRFNLENGVWLDTQMGSSFSFSPDEKFIAYKSEQDLVLYELNTNSKQSITIPEEYKAFGSFIWSNDSKKLIFVGSINDLEQEENPDGFTLYLLDLESMSIETIFEKDQRYLLPLEWLSPNIVLLESLFKVSKDGLLDHNEERFTLNLETLEVIQYHE